MSLRILFILGIWAISPIKAQTSNATCVRSDKNEWLFNSVDESPCLVWSKLQSLCLPSDSYINVPPLLDPSWGYNAPGDEGTICQCNSLSYSLMAGCTWCQLGDSGGWASVSTWKSSCPSWTEQGLNFAENVVSLPTYIFSPLPSPSDSWSPSSASSFAKTYTATNIPTYSLTLTRSFSTPTPTPTPSIPSSGTNSNPGTSSTNSSSAGGNNDGSGKGNGDGFNVSKWGPIVGAVFGSSLVLASLLALILRWRKRHPSSSSKPLPSSKIPPSSSNNDFGEKNKDKYLIQSDSESQLGYPKSTNLIEKQRQNTSEKTYNQKKKNQPKRGITRTLTKGIRSTLFGDPTSFFASRPAPNPDSKNRRKTGSEESFGAHEPVLSSLPGDYGGYTDSPLPMSALKPSEFPHKQGSIRSFGKRESRMILEQERDEAKMREWNDPPAFTGVDFTKTPAHVGFEGGAEIVTLSKLYNTPLEVRVSSESWDSRRLADVPDGPEDQDHWDEQDEWERENDQVNEGDGYWEESRESRIERRPFSDTAPTLPSLYEPQTGAERWTLTNEQMPSRLTQLSGYPVRIGLESPNSRYPETERNSRVDRIEMPDLPRGISDD
ncbi:hypothetical protein M231_03346 [Tremella mesenterica]|uniref:Uncharacterized protein n=1 Tax=Tremella mesenterica TaxID=5217 RepID=A0A4Q1BNE3_TREME|nr:hypothetical protein M231_03346 [Tremella mesenterica]